ncbi:MAG: TetR family transcriptional regulator [Desulfuromonas sp.]|uniref:TetR/AcrR family transcriptional regulator n=1 Tax=Desulfuromonas sp. TaxID=892 RepID=UPI000CB5B13F|nr:TetR/AcrR family transcriptional regulator [Desulfuromonas sp.]PLX84054.1 MAG: TetR family transcriptional regulator [Desulfuromonas sp.]
MNEKKTDKRRAILRSTMELIAEQGFHGTPTSQIAQRAGVGVGTIYRYFKDKDELIEEIHEENHALFASTFAENYDPAMPVRENYLAIFSALTRLFIANPFEIRFMEQYYNSPYGIAKKRAEEVECDKPLFAFFEQGKEQQVIKDLPCEVLMSLSFGPILFLTRDHLNGFVDLNDEMIATSVEATWDAVKR